MNQFNRKENIIFMMHFLSKCYMKESKEMLESAKLSRTMFFYMMYILKNPGVSMNSIAKEFQTDKSYITRLVIQLVEEGLVAKKSSQEDKRMQLLFVTENGKSIISRTKESIHKQEKRIQDSIEPHEFEALKSILSKMYHLEKEDTSYFSVPGCTNV